MDLTTIRIASFAVIALVYMLFDVFNKRNIPTPFAYGALAYGIALTVLYLNATTISISLAIAAAVGVLGYVIYRAGQIGAGDIFEFATLSLVLPMQAYTVFHTVFSPVEMPTIVSLTINTGIAAIIMVPLYYIPKAKLGLKKPLIDMSNRRNILKSSAVGIVYAAFVVFLYYIGMNAVGLAVISLLGIGSFATILFQDAMTESMVSYITWHEIEPEDMVAFNVMKKSDISKIKRSIHSFDRLVTAGMIKEMREKDFKEKIPVYRSAVPLAMPIFVGAVITLLVGNLIIFILPLHL